MEYEGPFIVISIGECMVAGRITQEVFQVLDDKAKAICDCCDKDAANLIASALNRR